MGTNRFIVIVFVCHVVVIKSLYVDGKIWNSFRAKAHSCALNILICTLVRSRNLWNLRSNYVVIATKYYWKAFTLKTHS